MAKYLDREGLNYFWGKIKDFFKITTTNNVTTIHMGNNSVIPVTTITAGTGLNTTSNDTTTDGGTIGDGNGNSGTLYLTKTGVTPNSYGPSTDANPSAGSSFTVPLLTVDKYGRVTAASDKSVTVPSAQTITQDGLTGATINRYGNCSTAAGTAAKVVSITSGTVPTLNASAAGLKVTVKFDNANTANNPTLNVSSKGAKNIFHNGTLITTGENIALLAGVCDFVFDGTLWHLVGNYINTEVTSVDNHYIPTADNNAELTGSLSGNAGDYAIDTEYTLLTGVKAQRDAAGHITGLTYTALKIKNTNTDTKVNVTKDLTTKAYLLGVSTTPTATALALETLSDTAVYLDTTAGKLTATNFAGKINDVTVTKASTGFTIAGGTTSKTLTVSDTYTLGAACAKAVDSSISANSTSTNLPTSAAVESRIAQAIATAQVGAAMFLGVIKSGTSLTALPTSGYKKGWYWIVGTAGTYAGVVCEAGDTIFCVNDYASAFSNDDFNVVQTNIETITNGEIDNIIAGS